MARPSLSRLAVAGAAAGALLLAGCSGGGGSSQTGGLELVSMSVPPGATWKINKKIEFEFSEPIDLSSVVFGSTVKIAAVGGGPAAFGKFDYKFDASGVPNKSVLVFQPFCPTQDDLSDAGLQPGGVTYQISFPGLDSSKTTVKATSGAKLDHSQTRLFITPNSFEPDVVFADTAVGPPAFLSAVVEVGDGTTRTFDGPTPTVPLNLYSDPESRVSYVVQLDQSVDPSTDNLDDGNVRIEFKDGAGAWRPFQTLIEIETNCPLDAPGARLRLTPLGILPQSSQVRVALKSGFTDLVGEGGVEQNGFVANTEAIAFASLTPSENGADEVFETFDLGGSVLGSFEDEDAAFDTPKAVWGAGELKAAFEFDGSGGPGGNFDWHVNGEIFFDTDFDEITGGKDGAPEKIIPVVGGVIDVNDLWVKPGARLRISAGANPVTILATGSVRIDGIIDVSGGNALPVGSLFVPNQPAQGAPGIAGGGKGGTGSFLTSASTPQGGPGQGAFGIPNAGGKGGETGYTNSPDKQDRRPGGGGGGAFAKSVTDTLPTPTKTLEAEMGGTGSPEATGAITGTSPPFGGAPGLGPFVDGNDDNDFFGRKAVFDGGALTGVVVGELGIPWAGAGGGAGGDAIKNDTFPTIPFGPPYIDKKGAGGGGGAGQIRILALGPIVFGVDGQIVCDGGDGATGENVLGFDHIAGSSGGGSGGHVILESATQIDFTDGGLNSVVRDFVSAVGGSGGIGQFGTGESKGGDGGPGVIQLHVPDSNPDTAVGTDPLTSAIVVPVTNPSLDAVTTPPGIVLVPTFGARSKARSRWIPIGAATQQTGGGEGEALFVFDGTDEDRASPTAGHILTSGEDVVTLPPILGPEGLGAAAPAPFVDTDGVTLVLSGPSLAPLQADPWTDDMPSQDIYLRNPALLRQFVVRLSGPVANADFDVVDATYDDAAEVLRITATSKSSTLDGFVDGQGGPGAVTYELIPRFFRVRTGSELDVLPEEGFVRILFQGTNALANGEPDVLNPTVDWTPDLEDFNEAAPGSVDFFRFEVEFDLADASAGGVLGVDTQPVSLEFLRMPFGF